MRNNELKWDSTSKRLFHDIKQHFISCTHNFLPDFTKPFILDTDASGYGIGGVLQQKCDETGELRPIMFVSRKLTDAEMKFCTREREALAILWSIERLRCYLYGVKFIYS